MNAHTACLSASAGRNVSVDNAWFRIQISDGLQPRTDNILLVQWAKCLNFLCTEQMQEVDHARHGSAAKHPRLLNGFGCAASSRRSERMSTVAAGTPTRPPSKSTIRSWLWHHRPVMQLLSQTLQSLHGADTLKQFAANPARRRASCDESDPTPTAPRTHPVFLRRGRVWVRTRAGPPAATNMSYPITQYYVLYTKVWYPVPGTDTYTSIQ